MENELNKWIHETLLEKGCWHEYADAYFEHLCYVTQDATWRPEYEKREVAFCLSLATATALQRCTAVRAAVEGK